MVQCEYECNKYATTPDGTIPGLWGYEASEHATARAALLGHIKCLKCAHEHGAPWHKNTTLLAAQRGNMECLEYAHEHGAPWNDSTILTAALRGNLECIRYATFRGCPWPSNVELKWQGLYATWWISAARIGRAWRRYRAARQLKAVATIEDAWLKHTYAPDGAGASRAAKRFRMMT